MQIGRFAGFVLFLSLAPAVVYAGDSAKTVKTGEPGSPYLLVWGGDENRQQADFMAVVDVRPSSATYGKVVRRVPVASHGMMPHHTEYEFPESGILFANAWAGGRTFILDAREAGGLKVQADFLQAEGYGFPHSFVRLPNGHVLATFQSHQAGYAPGGGLVELDDQGKVVRSASAVTPDLKEEETWPYSLAVAPALDRVVVSITPMGIPAWAHTPAGSWSHERVDAVVTKHVQIWRLSDLKLLHTFTLPPSPQGEHNTYPAEPRLLPDGTVYLNTFTCGLYRIVDLAGPAPKAEFLKSFPANGTSMDDMCAVPVIVGKYWIQTVGSLPGLIALDISDPDKPVEVSRLQLDHAFHMPHWLAADRKGNRLVLTGIDQDWVQIVNLDPNTGKMSLDTNFHMPGSSQPGVRLSATEEPSASGHSQLHGALFAPR